MPLDTPIRRYIISLMPDKTPERIKPISVTSIPPPHIPKPIPVGYELKPLPPGVTYQYSYYDSQGKPITEEQYNLAIKRQISERAEKEKDKTLEEKIEDEARFYFKDRTPTEREYKEFYLGRLLWLYNKERYIPSEYREQFEKRPSSLTQFVMRMSPLSESRKESLTKRMSYSTIPWQFQTLGQGAREKYIRESYEVAIGKQDIPKMEKDISRYFQKNITVNWAEQYHKSLGAVFGKKGELTWAEYKSREPAAYFAPAHGGGITIDIDPRRWQREQDIAWAERQKGKPFWEWDLGYIGGRVLSEIFSPERWETALEDVVYGAPYKVDDRWVVPSRIGGVDIVESAKEFKYGREKIFAGSQYEYTKAWGKQDWGKIGLRFISSPAGSILTFYGGGTLVKYGAKAVSPFFKYIVRTTPKVYGKYTQVFPQGSGLTTEYGKIVGRSYPRQLVSGIGQTRWWQNIYGWSTDSLTRVRYLPLVKTVETDLGEGFKGRTDIYRGWGRTDWVSPKVAYQTRVGTTGQVSLFEFQTGEWHGIQSRSMFEQVSKPKGRLWWKTIKTSTVRYSEFDPFKFETGSAIGGRGIADVWGGWVRPGSPVFIGIKDKTVKPFMANIWKDTSAYQTLTHPVHARPMISHGLKHSGYLAGRSIVAPTTFAAPSINMQTFLSGGLFSSSVLGLTQQGRQGLGQDLTLSLDFKQKFDTSLVSAQRQAIGVEEALKVDTISVQAQLLGYSQKQALLQQQVTVPYSSYKHKPIPVLFHPGMVFKTGKHLPKVFIPFLPGKSDPFAPAPTGEAYNVYVKDRVYVKGKKKYSEKFLKMNKQPLSRMDAMSLGGTLVDRSASATFYVKPTTGIPKRLRVKADPWNFISGKFYKKGDKHIENTMSRIDSPGEIKQITARGIMANMRKESRVRPVKSKKRVAKPALGLVDMQKEFESMTIPMNTRPNRLKRLF